MTGIVKKGSFVALAAVLAVGLATVGVLEAGDQKDHDHKAKDKKVKAEVGEKAPDFKLHNAEGEKVKLSELTEQEKVVVLEWFNPDCPYVKKHYEKLQTTQTLASKYADKDVVWLLVNSSHYADAEYNKKWAEKWSIEQPILVDQDGKVGKQYGAKTTPHMYIIDTEGTLVYAGAIDDNRSAKPRGEDEQTVNYVDEALQSLLAEEEISTRQTKPYGCSVKYGKQASAEPTEAPMVVASNDGGSCCKKDCK